MNAANRPASSSPGKSPRTLRWTPLSKTKRYCTCRQPWASRPMVQCGGRCQNWFHTSCVGLDAADGPEGIVAGSSSQPPYICAQCTAKGGEWLREPTYCVCDQPWGSRFMLECDVCARWFHGSCVGVSRRASLLLAVWHCADCTAAATTSIVPAVPAVRRAPHTAELPPLPADVWARIVGLVPVAERCQSLALVSHQLLAAVDATLECWARLHGIAPAARTGRPSRFTPSGLIASSCPWLHAVQARGCRCCLDAVGEFPCRRDPTVHAAALSTVLPLPKRFLLCRKCARREPLLVRLQLLGYEVATQSLCGKALFPRHFSCALGAAVGGVPDVS